jgi:hypothetical protein
MQLLNAREKVFRPHTGILPPTCLSPVVSLSPFAGRSDGAFVFHQPHYSTETRAQPFAVRPGGNGVCLSVFATQRRIT